MRPVSIPIAAALAGAAVPAAASGPSHVYNLDGSLADAWGGAALTLVGTPTLGPTGVDFVAGQGRSLSSTDFANENVFSIAIDFRFDDLTRYNRVLNFDGTDDGLYIHQGDGLGAPAVTYYEGIAYNGATFSVGGMHQLLFTRDEPGLSVYWTG